MQSLAAQGWPMSRMEAEGFVITTRSHRIEYQQPALLDDELQVTTWLSDLQDTTVARHTIITRPVDRAVISRARSVHAWVNLESGEAVTIPEAMATDMAPFIAG